MNEQELVPDLEATFTALGADATEDALALELTRKYGDTLRYVAEWGAWMAWTGCVWQPEKTLKVFDLARSICREASRSIILKTARAAVLKGSTVAAVEKLARSDRTFACTSDRWDSDGLQLNTVSGTVDLLTGKLRTHTLENFHTKCAGTSVSDKRPELWLRFLDRVTGGDKELQDYLRRMCGYCLTGSTQEHSLFFFYGTGANGKSVFTTALQGILGDYARSCPQELFVETRNEQHPCAVAALQSVRLALVQETEKGSSFAESRLKQMTGGDKLTARYMHQNFFEFVPQFKVLIAGNHRPRLSSVDEAVRRRFHLIPFAVTIPAEERDPRLSEKLKAEYPAVLGWCIQGCLEWRRDGLNPPKSVVDATSDYLSNEDRIGLWLKERCEVGNTLSVGSGVAFKDFKLFCEDLNERPGRQRDWKQDLESREGIDSCHTRTGTCFTGFGLKSNEGGN